jgi:hypothetical protein
MATKGVGVMIWEALVYLAIIFAVLILFAMAVASVWIRLADRRKAHRQASEFVAWMDTVDRTVGISELLKGK